MKIYKNKEEESDDLPTRYCEHNVATMANMNGIIEPFRSVFLKIPDHRVPNRNVQLVFSDASDPCNADAIDISWGNPVRSSHLMHPDSWFERVMDDFVLETKTPSNQHLRPRATRKSVLKRYMASHTRSLF